MSLRLYLDTLPAELELRMNRPVEHEVGTVCVERRHWGVMGHLENKDKDLEIKKEK